MSQDGIARTKFITVAIVLVLAVFGSFGYLIGPVSGDDVLEPGFDQASQPSGNALDEYLRGGHARRALWTAGIPAESLLLAEANSASATETTSQESRSTGTSEEHKDLLPLNKWDVVTLVLASLGLMISAAGGIGGGGILVPIFILVLGLRPKYAVPLSNITIFGGAITNTFLNLKKRHPRADRPLIEWDLILAMEPLTIGGALIGSFIQKVLPEIVLTFMMILLLLVTADRTLRKGAKTFKKESMQQKTVLDSSAVGEGADKKVDEALLRDGYGAAASYGSAAPIQSDNDSSQYEDGHFPPAELSTTVAALPCIVANEETDGIIIASPESPEVPVALKGHSATEPSLKHLLDQERKTPLRKVGTMTAIFVVLLTVNLLKGGGAFQSPVGIVCGSLAFWTTSVLCLVYLVVASLGVRCFLIKQWRLKENLGYNYIEGDIEWSPLNTIRYPAICCFAGFFAGMFGVGGGIIKGPLMLEMGVHPMVASATSAVMILYTSFTATTSFMVFGLLKTDYAVLFFSLGLVATAVGQTGTDYLVKKFKRPSFIIISIGAVVAISALLMGYNGIKDIVDSRAAEQGDEITAGICDAGV